MNEQQELKIVIDPNYHSSEQVQRHEPANDPKAETDTVGGLFHLHQDMERSIQEDDQRGNWLWQMREQKQLLPEIDIQYQSAEQI